MQKILILLQCQGTCQGGNNGFWRSTWRFKGRGLSVDFQRPLRVPDWVSEHGVLCRHQEISRAFKGGSMESQGRFRGSLERFRRPLGGLRDASQAVPGKF